MSRPTGTRASEGRRQPKDIGFGARIKHFRTSLGLTMQQLAERAGLAVSTISKVEQGHLSPTYENILRLAEGLDVDVAELFNASPFRMTSGRRSVTRAGQGDRLNSEQYDYQMLCADLSRKQFIPLLTRLKAHSFSEFPGYIQHAGEEFIYVLSGHVELRDGHLRPAPARGRRQLLFRQHHRTCLPVGRPRGRDGPLGLFAGLVSGAERDPGTPRRAGRRAERDRQRG